MSADEPFFATSFNPVDRPLPLCVNSYSCSVVTVPDKRMDGDDVESLSSCESMPGLDDDTEFDVNEWIVRTVYCSGATALT